MHIQRSLLSRAAAPLLVTAALLLGCSSGETSGRETPAGESQFGIDGSQSLTSLAVGADGAIALTGSFDHTIDFGALGTSKLVSAGGPDVFVAVLGPSGDQRWSGRTGSDGVQQGTGIALTKDGEVLLAGNFSGTVNFGLGKLESMATNAFLCRFDRDGNALWSKVLGADSLGQVNVSGLALAPDDSVFVGGSFDGTQNFGAGEIMAAGTSSFIARYDTQGRHLFSIALAGQSNQITALAVDSNGAVIFGGVNSGSIVFGKEFSSVDGSGFVGRLEPNGTPGWLIQLGGHSSVSSVAVSKGGDVVLGGTYSGQVTFGDNTSSTSFLQGGFVAKLSSAGAPLWFKSFESADSRSEMNFGAIAIDDAERVLFTGSLRGTIDLGGGPVTSDGFNEHMFLAELDKNGSYQRSKGFGGSGGSIGTALALDPAGGVVYGGTFSGSLQGAVEMHQSKSPQDILVVRQPE